MMQNSSRSLAPAVSSVTKSRPRTHVQCRPSIQTPLRGRGFANSPTNYASIVAPGGVRMPKNAAKLMPKQQGMKSRLKTLQKSETPSDFGLLPKSFIKPPGKDLPKLFSRDFRNRLGIEWFEFKSTCENFTTLVYMAKWAGVGKNPENGKIVKMPLMMNERNILTRELHKEYYTALAKGDLVKIREIASTGLVESSSTHIERQKLLKKPEQVFQIKKYLGVTYPRWLPWPLVALLPNKSTKVMLDRLVPLPIGTNSWIRQIVVRLRSEQILRSESGPSQSAPLTKDLTEYVVIQKTQINGNELPWKIWGTTTPTTGTHLEEMVGGASSDGLFSTFSRNLKAKMSSMSGGLL